MKLLLALLPVIALAQVQNPQIGYTTTDPTGNACGNTRIQLKTPDGKLYTCQAGHMALVQNATGTPTNPVVVTFNTATTTCSATGGGTTPTCTATASPAKVIAVHNLGTTTPITECYDSTGLAAGSAGSAFGVPGIQVNTSSQETITFSVPANGTCVISSGGAGPVGATGPAGGVTSVYALTGAVVPTGANIVSSFTGCSGTQYLGADGACHSITADKQISMTFDGGGLPLSGTASRCVPQIVAATIQSASIIADQSGSVTIDVRTVVQSSYTGPGSASTITAAATPVLSSAAQATPNVGTWTTAIAANSVVCFVMSAPTTVQWATLSLDVK